NLKSEIKRKKDISDDNSIQVPETQNIEIEEPIIKKHKTTDAEEQILKQLEHYKEAFLLLLEIVNELVEQLVEVE
ncbi:4120_t:CDS:2, partial [Scutellospora calospora]